MTEFVGIDAGSTFLKGAVIDAETVTLKRIVRVPTPPFLAGLAEGHREIDPRAVMTAVDELLDTLAPDPAACAGVVLCGQMHGVVLMEAAGEPVSNYISWLDQRVSAAEFAELATLVDASRAEIGNEFRASIGISFLYWLKQRGLVPRGATPVSMADFIAARLSNTRPVMEPTQAAAFGLVRIATGAWHRELIARTGLDSLAWPALAPAGALVGHWRGVPCWATAGDQQCTLAGALLGEGELSVNIGTGSQVGMLTASSDPRGLQLRPYFDGLYLRTITHIPGGRALAALAGLVTELGNVPEDEAWWRIDEAVARTPATDLRAAMAFYPGPCGDRGALENLHEANMHVGHVFRAAFEAMARDHAACARRLDPESAARRLVFSGGVARRNRLLRELTAGELALAGRVSPHDEDSLVGLAVLARAYSGLGIV
jgi:sugar (pentulose or hexulose) kinase